MPHLPDRRVVAAGLVALAATVLAACQGSDTPGVSEPPPDPCSASVGTGFRTGTSADLTIWAVAPQSTDRCITQRLDSHVVFRAVTAAPVGRLLVFLPGTDGVAQNYQLILAQAARVGYHAIGLSYPNLNAVTVLCATQPTNCYGDTRREILTGDATSTVVTVDRANSIENRLIKLLRFMHASDAGGNWSRYLTGDTAVTWQNISIAGHSQGGGHALYIAQRYSVYRATTYASYGDGLPNGTGVAPWVTRPYATPVSRIFGLVSTFDEVISPIFAISVWSAIGMGAGLIDVDITNQPFGVTQRFITAAQPFNAALTVTPNHNVVAVDVNTPRFASMLPTFGGIWRALSFPP